MQTSRSAAPQIPADRLYLSKQEVALTLGVSLPTVDAFVRDGLIPEPIRLSKRTLRWRRSEIDKIGTPASDHA